MDLNEIFNNSTTKDNIKNIDKDNIKNIDKDNIKNIDKDSRTSADTVDELEEIDAKRLYDAWNPEFENKKDEFLYYSVLLFLLILCSPLFLLVNLLDKIDALSDKNRKMGK